MKPVALDLCNGMGGWTDGAMAAGFDVVGVDIYRHKKYRGAFIELDLLDSAGVENLIGRFSGVVDLVLASPPCDEFARWDKPACWFPLGRPEPSTELVKACRLIAARLDAPLVLENVRGAQPHLGTAVSHYGPFYFWGDGVPPLLPYVDRRTAKFKNSGWSPATRARIPFEIAHHIAAFHSDSISRGEPYHNRSQWSGYEHVTRVMRAQWKRAERRSA